MSAMERESWIKDKICLITGANSGIGKQTAFELNRMGANVVMFCRNKQRAENAMNDIKNENGNTNIDLIIGDLADLDSVRQAVSEFKNKYDKLHVLINNAGSINAKKQLTVDGFEKTWGTNYLGHFLLTMLLLEKLKASAPSRIIILSSIMHKYTSKNPLEDMNYEHKKYKHFEAYGNSKLMNLWFTYELARKLEGTGVTVNAVHPGIIRTRFGKNKDNPWWYRLIYTIGGPFLNSVAKGARTPVYLASSDEVSGITGKYWVKSKQKKSSKLSRNIELQKQLWEKSLEFTKN